MTGTGGIVEVQGTAETVPFSQESFDQLMALAKKGIAELVSLQKLTVAVSCCEGRYDPGGRSRNRSLCQGPRCGRGVLRDALGMGRSPRRRVATSSIAAAARYC
jgi:hypothetical protein